jgi:predicted DCC family thiol-disulfide oxidoreductase YuxK
MISLANEYTDSKGQHARGWLFYDAECGFCFSCARRVAPILARRGMATAALQDPRVSALLGISGRDLLRELRFVLSDGRQYGGADAVLAVAREIWWARPLLWAAHLPGIYGVLRASYHRFASQRHCAAAECAAAGVPRR